LTDVACDTHAAAGAAALVVRKLLRQIGGARLKKERSRGPSTCASRHPDLRVPPELNGFSTDSRRREGLVREGPVFTRKLPMCGRQGLPLSLRPDHRRADVVGLV